MSEFEYHRISTDELSLSLSEDTRVDMIPDLKWLIASVTASLSFVSPGASQRRLRA